MVGAQPEVIEDRVKPRDERLTCIQQAQDDSAANPGGGRDIVGLHESHLPQGEDGALGLLLLSSSLPYQQTSGRSNVEMNDEAVRSAR